jgi:hypothetical protein
MIFDINSLEKQLTEQLGEPVGLLTPDYLEVVNADGEMVATLEKMERGYQLRIDGEFRGYYE